MTERDWDAEMRKIDEQMARAGKRADQAPAPAAAAPVARSGVPVAPVGLAPATTGFGVYIRLTLAVVVGIGIIFWPYAARCGVPLMGYLGAVATVILSGLWSAVWTWRHRAARAHLLSLLVVVWGLVLAGIDILPRTGYAVPTEAHPAGWSCS
jgi:hypothetical protein